MLEHFERDVLTTKRTLDMDLTHVRAFTDAVQRKDLEAMLSHMTEDIVLETPFFAELVRGKAALRTVVGALLYDSSTLNRELGTHARIISMSFRSGSWPPRLRTAQSTTPPVGRMSQFTATVLRGGSVSSLGGVSVTREQPRICE